MNTIKYFILAMAPTPGQNSQQVPFWANLVPLILLIVVFYFVLIRPQQKKLKEHSEMLKTLRPGDKVTTSGGLVGVVVAVKEKTVSIRSQDSKLEILKSAVSEIIERGNVEENG
jgi:preprotein translocase subunit YajC